MVYSSSQHNVVTVDAQLMSPIEPVCPGNRVIFTCQLPGAITRWRVFLPQQFILENTARTSQYGLAPVKFAGDPGFNFEIHVVSNSSTNATTELQVTAVRELNGVTVECDGPSTSPIRSTIEVASIGNLIIINYYLIIINYE